MATFEVKGGTPLEGEIRPQGAKNEALQVLCATLLTPEKVIIHNIPAIVDVLQLIELFEKMGVIVHRLGEGSYSFEAKEIDFDYLQSDDYRDRAARLRGSVMIIGPLLARYGVGYIPKPGGDKIGRRRLDTHFIGWFENKNQGTRFVRVDADVVDKLIEKENNLKMALSSAQQDLLRPVFEAQLPAEDKIRYTVSFEPMAENQMPVMITQNEFMRRMKDMAAMGGSGMQFYGQLPDNFNVVINGNHPLVAEILGEVEASYGDKLKTTNKKLDAAIAEQRSFEELVKDKKAEDFSQEEKDKQQEVDKKVEDLRRQRTERLTEIGRENKLVKQVVDLALLSNSMLKGENLTNFIRRSVELIGK